MEVARVSMSGEPLVPRSLDRLLLDEANHRIANEVSAALAALRLASSAKGRRSGGQLIALAISRLEGFGECARILAGVTTAATDAGHLIEQLCRAMLRARVGKLPARVILDLSPVVVNGELARRTAMIAYELITNSLKYAFPVAGGELEIRLKVLADNLVLTVIDDGPGLSKDNASITSGKRLGGRIVGEIVRACSGCIECESSLEGTTVHVLLPLTATTP